MTVGRQAVRTIPGTISPVPSPPPTRITSANSNHSRTYEPLSRNSNYSRTYAIPRGWGGISIFPGPTFKHHLKCRRADIGYSLWTGGCWLSAISSPLSSFTASLTRKQGGRGCWSYQFKFGSTDLKVGHYRGRAEWPASEGGHYNGKRAEQAQPLHVSEWDIVGVARTWRDGSRLGRGWWLNCSFRLPIEGAWADRGKSHARR